ncbi:MAG: hypothetical protein N2544_00085 [Burkholderiales bacterium]|nr:hypothetical protein [Burkholderiales bacterium]
MRRVVIIGIVAAACAPAAFAQEAGFIGLRADPARASAAGGFGLRLGAASEAARWGFAAPAASDRVAWSPRLTADGASSWAYGGIGDGRAFAFPAQTAAALDYRFERWTLSSSLRQGLGERSTAIDLGARYGFSLAPRHSLALLGSVGLGDHSAMRALAMSELDALRVRPPGLGFRDVGAQLSMLYTYSETWYVNTTLGYARLLGDPADAGTPDRNVTSVGAYFGYRF